MRFFPIEATGGVRQERKPAELYDQAAFDALRVCGAGPLAVLDPSGVLVDRIRSEGCLVEAIDPGAPSVPRGAFVVAFCPGDVLDPAGCLALLEASAKHGRGLIVSLDSHVPGAANPAARDWWEREAFARGLRRHPLYFDVIPYGSLEAESRLAQIPLERVLSPSDPDPDDPARAVGRRAEARMMQFSMAAALVRPGDAIVVSCSNRGACCHVLRHAAGAADILGLEERPEALAYARANYAEPGVTFTQAPGGTLAGVGDGSRDMVVCMDLGRIPDRPALVAEACRVLRPGGRFFAGIRYGADDGASLDKAGLLAVVGGSLRVEGLWVIDGSDWRRREIRKADYVGEEPGEWLVVSAILDPVGASAPFADTIYPTAGAARNIVAYARDYANPWLMRAMFGMGVRALDPGVRARIARETLARAPAGSPDAGAATCVLGYQAIEPSGAPARLSALAGIDAWLAAADGSPHSLRWRVSLLFLKGRLLMLLGRAGEAEEAFLAIGTIDWLSFSPTLATKAVEASWLVGRIREARGDVAGARAAWRAGMAAAVAAMGAPAEEYVGDPECPLPDTFAEMGQALDLAQRCALALNAGTRFSPQQAWLQAQRNQAWERRKERLSAWSDRDRLAWRFDRIEATPLGRTFAWLYRQQRSVKGRVRNVLRRSLSVGAAGQGECAARR